MIKKNITINFCGRLYNIDEDAYELLKHYTDTIRRYYSKQEGTEEVADDIEARIAELFDEQKAMGHNAVTIEMTEEVIHRIGELSDIAPEEQGNDNTEHAGESNDNNDFIAGIKDYLNSASNTLRSGKRFYLDGENKIICGVMAGYAQYFGGTAFSWRAGVLATYFILHFFAKLLHLDTISIRATFLISYFIIAIIAPKAEAPEEVLKMKGKNVTPQNLAEEVSRQTTNNHSSSSMISSFFNKLFTSVLSVIVVGAFIIAICTAAIFFTNPSHWLGTYSDFYETTKDSVLMFTISMLIGLGILAYCVLHSLATAFNKTNSMSFGQRMIWFATFIACVVICIVSAVNFYSVYDEWREKEANNIQMKWEKEHTHDGIIYSDEDWEYFKNNGWKMVKAENYGDHGFTYHGQYFTGDDSYRYLDACKKDQNKELVIHVEHKDSVKAGKYSLSCIARASEGAKGVYIYVVTEKDGQEVSKVLLPVVAIGDEGRNIISNKEYAIPVLETKYNLDDIIKANNNKGFGWSYQEINDIIVTPGSIVKYGISTDKNFTNETCTAKWFSACDFSLSKEE